MFKNKDSDNEKLKTFLESANESEIDLLENQQRQIKRLEIGIIMFFVITVIAISGYPILLPLKQIIPWMLVADKSSGRVDSLEMLTPSKVSMDESVIKYFLRLYVINRESYAPKLIQQYYDYTMLMSSSDEKVKYDALYTGDNALDKKYGSEVEVIINPLTIIPDLKEKKAIVRFEKIIKWRQRDPVTQYWSADISYDLDLKTKTEKLLTLNPLGFTVDAYHAAQDVNK
ncbi:type IV secretion system protein [Dickeya dadantii]|uniref:virB8 family protein n=1 Tax=Dickeya dadantii TaxID=204038 RepID=UPI001495471F|nr:type IV secretion system protein [Dickeya dadantii]NPE55589.1 type IV secretion system protein [Dickeya dadantii]NPE68977.1 type IV secretion system protein [Dickeya dadantii]